MTANQDNSKIQYEAALRRQEMSWRASFELVLESDRAAVEIGIGALKTAILINAGALVALLAFIAQFLNDEKRREIGSHIISASLPFVFGVISGALAFAIAYFYQSAITALEQKILDSISAKNELSEPEPIKMSSIKNATKYGMLIFTGISLISFIWGSFAVICALRG